MPRKAGRNETQIMTNESAAPRPRDAIREKIGELFNRHECGDLTKRDLADAIHALVLSQRKEVWEKAAQQAINLASELQRNAKLPENTDERATLLSEAVTSWDIVGRIRRLAADEPQEGEADHV